MRLKKEYLLLILVFLVCPSFNIKKKEYTFPGEYRNKTAQGMAIHKNFAFLLNDGGYCRIYDLKKKKLKSEFNLASADKNNHANCASFGVEYPKGNRKYPAFYVSECKGQYRCFVESINEKGSELIQTLRLDIKGVHGYNWIVDAENRSIYTMTPTNIVDSLGVRTRILTKFALPPLARKDVVFVKEDIIDQFEIKYPNLGQGGTIYKDRLYLPVGLHDYKGSEKRKDKTRAIIIVDLKKQQIDKTIYIGDIVTEEPEDVDFYKKNLLLYCGQEGGLYKLDIN